MLATLFENLIALGGGWTFFSIFGVFSLFALWMCIDAIRRGEWIWAVLIWVFPFINPILYYIFVYRANSASRGFELPGKARRMRIKELEAQIHHIGNAVHYFQLGDVYFRQGKFQKAEACYRAALEREPEDIDARAHLGQCLLRLKRPAEARPLLDGVCAEDPKHDYGYSMMALAESLAALNQPDAALAVWLKVTANHSYPRAKVQLAEIYIARNQLEPARAELRDILTDDAHAPAFQRKRDRVWVRRARAIARKVGVA